MVLQDLRAVTLIISRSKSKLSYLHGATSQPLKYHTIGETLTKAVERKPDKEFLIFKAQNIRKTFQQVHEDARKFAAGLLALGLKKGDRVGVWGHNYYEWTVAQFGTGMAGLIQVNINPAYKSRELQYALQTVGVRCLITPRQFKKNNYMSLINEICPSVASAKPGEGHVSWRELPELEHIIVWGSEEKVSGAWDFTDIWNSAGSESFRELDELERRILPDEPINIQYTSGTTGYPKAATLTHHSVVNNAYFTGQRSGWDREDKIICIPNPLYHAFGCMMGSLNAAVHQQTCVFPAINFQIGKVIRAIEEERCNFIFGTPTMFIDMLASPALKQHDVSTISGGYIAGAPCPRALCEHMQRDLNMKDLYICYGSTELSPVITMSVNHQPPLERVKNVGYIMPNTEIAIVDNGGKVLPRGEQGELVSRGYMVMRGYWGDEERTKREIDAARWYHTGDTASMNEDGSICIVGRTKEMIIRGGENIFPTEIEQFIFTLPYIADVHVIGVPDDRLGEAVCAWVRLQPGMEEGITEARIKEDCVDKITAFKIPTYILIKNEDDFPLTATGKVKKYELREMSKKLLGLERVQYHFNA